MKKITRRNALKTMAALAAGASLPRHLTAAPAEARDDRRIPLVHITDLYHPPQDPDDHLDLATIVALPEYDLRGVVLDVTKKFLVPKPEGWDIARDPGYVPVAQLAHLTGRAIPAAMGPIAPLAHPGDAALDRPALARISRTPRAGPAWSRNLTFARRSTRPAARSSARTR